MGMETIVGLGRQTLETTVWIAGPLLVFVMLVSVLINVAQVLTSLQDVTLSTVPRLAVVAGALFLMMPWMLRRLMMFALQLFSDFRPLVN
jgi:flagellar biosynthesis protein FliQ